MLDVSHTAPYEITLAPLSICSSLSLSIPLSVRPSLSFLKIGSIVISDIVHDYTWPRYVVTVEARFQKKKKKNGDPNLDQNWAQNKVFHHFLKFASLVFLEIGCNDSLQ